MNNSVNELNKILSSYSKGNKRTAYSKLKKIHSKNPNNEKIQFNLAIMEQDQGLNNLAIMSYKKLIDKFDNFNAQVNLYLLYLKNHHYTDAIKTIDKILEKKPKNNTFLLDKAYALLKLKSIENCKIICNSIFIEQPNYIKAINLFGQCLLEENKYKEAEEKFLEGISYEKNNIAILNSLAKLYFETWDLEKSEHYYLNALKYDPASYQTLNNIAGFGLEEADVLRKAIIIAREMGQSINPEDVLLDCFLSSKICDSYFGIFKLSNVYIVIL